MNIDKIEHLKRLSVNDLFRLCVLSFIISVAVGSFGLSGSSFAHFGIWMVGILVPVSLGFAFHGLIIAVHLKRRLKQLKNKPA